MSLEKNLYPLAEFDYISFVVPSESETPQPSIYDDVKANLDDILPIRIDTAIRLGKKILVDSIALSHSIRELIYQGGS